MAGKMTVFASRRLHYAVDKLSKNALIDVLVDRVRANVGESATDEQIAAELENWITPALHYRGDRTPAMAASLAAFDALEQRYRDRQKGGAP